MCTVHDDTPELARLSRLRKSQTKGLLVTRWSRTPSSMERPCAMCNLGFGGHCVEAARLALRRSRHWIKSKNPAAPAVKREAEEVGQREMAMNAKTHSCEICGPKTGGCPL